MQAPIPAIKQALELLDAALAGLARHGATPCGTADLAISVAKLRRAHRELPAALANGRTDVCNGCRYYGETVTHAPFGDRDQYAIGSNCSATTPDHCPLVRACRGEA
jgi:hypothetical protein